MEIIVILQAVILGILEGLTEFIPVSSTGHLILAIDIIGFQSPKGKVFEIVIQLGAILAICWLYRRKIWDITSSLHKDKSSQKFALNIFIGFLPAAVLGVMFHKQIKEVLFSPIVVSVMLIVGGILIIIIEKCKHSNKFDDISKMPIRTAILIGFAQCLAMIPGTSRSGATVMGALLCGTTRKTAIEFSFFLAIPTMIGATVYDVYKNLDNLSADNTLIIILGFISAFLSALLVVRVVVDFISKHGFIPFAYYRIVIGSVMLAFFYL